MLFSSFASATNGVLTADGANRWNISDCPDLNQTGKGIYLLSDYYQLTNDIDCSDTKNWDGSQGFEPLGTLSGKFDGKSFKIINLTINRPGASPVGLFGGGFLALINNTGLVNVNISGLAGVGGLLGSDSTSEIENSYITGKITASGNNVGGLVGSDSNSITIINSSSAADITGNMRVGGLIGDCSSSAGITNSYSTGIITGFGQYVGGLIGYDSSTSIITNSYSTGSVNGIYGVGGLVGNGAFIITNSYSTASLFNSSGSAGRIVGTPLSGTCTNVFWDNETSGPLTDNCPGSPNENSTPKTAAQMRSKSTFTGVGWDFTDIWEINANTNANSGFPYFKGHIFSALYSAYPSSTDFNSASNPNNVTNAVLSNGQSSIRWQNGINANGADFNSHATFGPGFVSIDVSSFDSSINTTANVTFRANSCNALKIYHASSYFTTLGQIISNGVDCTTDSSCDPASIKCVFNGAYATVTFTAYHFDGFGGSSGGVPEFSTITTIVALAIVLSGFFVMRNKTNFK